MRGTQDEPMTVRAFLGTKYGTTEENKVFDELLEKLSERWQDSDDLVAVLGNFFCNGSEIDAAIIKKDSITVVDFKNYGGRVTFSENDYWYADEIRVRGGNKLNPFQQIRDNKYALLNYLQDRPSVINPDKNVNYGHISGIVVFHRPIEFDQSMIGHPTRMWFHVTDIDHISQLLYQITSKQIQLSKSEILNIPESLGIKDYAWSKSTAEIVRPSPQETLRGIRHTASQLEALEHIERFMSNPDEKVFMLKGPVSSGKTALIPSVQNIAYRHDIQTCKLLMPSRRLVRHSTLPHEYSFNSVYSYIYESVPSKSREASSTGETSREPDIVFDLRSNEDPTDTVYVIDEAELLGDTYFEFDECRYGTGYLLSDVLTFVDLPNTCRKLVLIGDDMIIGWGNRQECFLSKSHLADVHNLKLSCFELTNVILDENRCILESALSVREQIVRQEFNRLPVRPDGASVVAIDRDQFHSLFQDCTKKSPCGTVFINYTNDQCKRTNKWIRENLFDRKKDPAEGDVVIFHKSLLLIEEDFDSMVTHTHIPNGEVGTVLFVNPNSEVIQQRLKGRDKPIELVFRDMTIRFPDSDIPDKKIKILENFLYSKDTDISPDESIALRTNFKERLKKASDSPPKRGTPEYWQAMRSDAYLSAARVKYGYSVTGHKSIGAHWDNVFVNLDVQMGQFIENYFRWVYSTMTRAKRRLVLVNMPIINPYIKIAWADNKAGYNIGLIDGSTIPYEREMVSDSTLLEKASAYNFPDDKPFLLQFWSHVYHQLSPCKLTISSIRHNNFQEQYAIAGEGEQEAVVCFYYNKEGDFTKLQLSSASPKDFGDEVVAKIKSESQYQGQGDFGEDYLNEFYCRYEASLKEIGIDIYTLEKKDWCLVFHLVRGKERAITEHFYNSDGFFTRASARKFNSKEMVDVIKEVVVQMVQSG